MKNFYKHLKISLFIATSLGYSILREVVAQALSGNYTIGSGGQYASHSSSYWLKQRGFPAPVSSTFLMEYTMSKFSSGNNRFPPPQITLLFNLRTQILELVQLSFAASTVDGTMCVSLEGGITFDCSKTENKGYRYYLRTYSSGQVNVLNNYYFRDVFFEIANSNAKVTDDGMLFFTAVNFFGK